MVGRKNSTMKGGCGIGILTALALLLAACGQPHPASTSPQDAQPAKSSAPMRVNPAKVPLSTLSPAPPGTVKKVLYAKMTGKGPDQIVVYSLVTLSKPTPNAPAFTQPYLTIYSYTAGRWTAVFQSPGSGKAAGALIAGQSSRMPFPMRFGLVGAADLMGNGRQQLVASFWSTGADCGSTDVDVLAYLHGKYRISLNASNFCGLGATISGSMLVLSGGYYGPTSAMCCPTIQNARATVRYDKATRTWQEQPNYFSVQTNK